MDSNTLRHRFLTFFEQRDHRVVPSASLVPGNDPTLLFTNAGMVQFKDVFLGREKRDYQRAASSQRCVRAGGKHNDLENVGYTARHHTFFEMLGNFSFGDYFKREAIVYAWEFLTSPDWLRLPADKLLATVYATDEEAFAVWRDVIGLPETRILRIGDKPEGGSDNFWQMGDTGPCGPCSEIFYDHGPDVPGGPPGTPEEDGDRFIEIWNLVFMQYDRAADGTLTELPAPSVDTGMGLERLAAVLQGVHSNYDTDVFQRLMAAAAEVIGVAQDGNASLKVIADHIRAVSFLICDGVMPSNEGRGYVLRRIIRRAARHGHKLGAREPFLHRMVAPLGEVMGEAYRELQSQQKLLEQTIRAEEDAFAQMLDRGLRLLDDSITPKMRELPGDVAFHLYDTHGFPVDLTADILRERDMTVDMEAFEQYMQAQRDRARAASRFSAGYDTVPEQAGTAEFTGYEQSQHGATVTALIVGGTPVEQLEAGDDEVVVFLDRTPFYAESGGQVGDTGHILAPGLRFRVRDTRALRPGTPGHIGQLEEGRLRVGDVVKAEIDGARRARTVRNHSATHLLHAALRNVLGTHVAQKGSLVAPERLRFDFSHPQPVTDEELQRIEDEVNAQILANVPARTDVCPYQEAIDRGALAMFGEKYGDTVRVLALGDYSVELCGGTHVSRTGDIGAFRIIHEGGVSAGVRRVEAITGDAVITTMRQLEARMGAVAQRLRAAPDDVINKLDALLAKTRETERALEQARDKLSQSAGGDLATQAQEIDGIKVLAARIEGQDAGGMRGMLDKLKERLGSGVIVLGAEKDGKAVLAAGVTADLTDRIQAGKLINHVAGQVGGKGGGRPDMAQAGGPQPEHLQQALDSVTAWVSEQLTS
ncbi:alanine--tRNA ligase [Algiphilus sp.]|uniref:alanine--tRNA ligase n=1 Tax=Algiphilus sp. TaxID=1872431 RepID=UPI003B52107D